MLTENQKKWVEALRSGEYSQGANVLEGINGDLCCLGVVCKVYEKETGEILEKDKYNGTLIGGSLMWYPEVKKWLKINYDFGGFGSTSLAGLNDNGKPFNEIADIIESEPEGLLVK